MRSLLTLTVLLAGAVSAFAQNAAVPKIEFNDAIQRAVANNPTIAQAATAITRANLLVDQARAVNRPTVTGRVVNSTLDTGVSFGGGTVQPRNQTTIGVDASASILNLARWSSVEQARDQIKVAELSTEQTRRDIAVAAAEAYLAVIASQRQVDVDQRAVETARAHLTYAQQRLQAGAGSRLNEIRAASAVSTSEMRLENSRHALRRTQEALGVLVAADTPMDAGAEPVFDAPATVSEQDWMRTRPEVQLQQATQRAAERVLRDSWRDTVGTATASFTPQVVAPAGLFQPSRTWRLTVSFSQPIFEGGLRKTVKSLRSLQIDQSKLVLSSILIRVRSDVRLAEEAVQSAGRALASARTASTQTADVLRITTSAFELGGTTNIEVIDAQRSTRDADSTTAIAEDALRRARLELLVAIGRFPR